MQTYPASFHLYVPMLHIPHAIRFHSLSSWFLSCGCLPFRLKDTRPVSAWLLNPPVIWGSLHSGCLSLQRIELLRPSFPAQYLCLCSITFLRIPFPLL